MVLNIHLHILYGFCTRLFLPHQDNLRVPVQTCHLFPITTAAEDTGCAYEYISWGKMVFGNQAEAFQEETGKMINLCFQDKLRGCSSGINTLFFIDKMDLFFLPSLMNFSVLHMQKYQCIIKSQSGLQRNLVSYVWF